MKCANPHPAHIHRQHARQTRKHFFGGLVGKRHSHHATGRDLPGLHEPRDARGEHASFTRACARQNQGVLVGQSNGSKLLGVEVVEQRHLSRRLLLVWRFK
jgi:hypothetical protein